MVRVGFVSAALRDVRKRDDGRCNGNKINGAAARLSAAVLALAATVILPQGSARAAASGVTFTSVYSFGADSNATGAYPKLALTRSGATGDYYGVTYSAGANFDGTVYRLTPSGAVSTVYAFSALAGNGVNADGAMPSGPLTIDAAGNLYGVTQSGGPSGAGAVFKITPGGAYTLLYGFPTNANGSKPSGRLVLGSDGNLYGTTAQGGANNTGTVYRLSLSTGAYSVLHSFAANGVSGANADGDQPTGLVVGTNGSLYGATIIGGASNSGTLYEISTTGTFKLLYAFSALTKSGSSSSNEDGEYPNGDFAFDGSGNFYGTAQKGGANNTGTIFEFSAADGFTTLHSFASTSNLENGEGAGPFSGLTYASDGNLYGSADYGGSNGKGTLFKITPTGTYTTLHTFNGDGGSGNVGGANPYSSLIIGADGDLYGTAYQGGANDRGVIFKVYVGVALTAPTLPVTPVITNEARFDFNHDGHADLVWYNTGSGAISVWDMNDESVLQFGSAFAQLAPSTGWQPVAAPDVNGDSSPDLIWWNNQTGELSAWTLSNTAVTRYGGDFATLSDTTWKPVAAADVTGSAWELVFQNSVSGNLSRWLMNGTTVVQYGGTLGSVGAGTGWQCVGAPDLDGDGKSDLLYWNDQTGEVSYWSTDLSAGSVLAYHGDIAQVSDTSWHLQGSEDTDGDGHPDLVWWNAASGVESRWLMNGAIVTQYGAGDTQVQDTTWQPTAIR